MKFLCDEMFSGLGKWLRTAGYDTKIAEEAIADKEIMEWALREQRKLITRDHHFRKLENGEGAVVFLTGNSIDEWIRELNLAIRPNWVLAPFTRCLQCNTPLEKPDEKTILAQAPPDVRSRSTEFRYCPTCNKVFWHGSHTEKMLKQLQLWQTF
ncbi:MAG: DUF5615 family PIN-like protein [Candidatus Melainabacteria bacterium]|nr:DUF5615 family PIN-like protein [Candidatus Melainabacteria bacterium]